MNRFRIQSDPSPKTSTILLHPSHAAALGAPGQKEIWLHFGIRRHCASIRYTDGIEASRLALPSVMVKHLGIPLYCEYELKYSSNVLRIGPFFGFILSNKTALNVLQNYVNLYPKIGGALAAFKTGKIRLNHPAIEGFIYHPVERRWRKEKMYYPASIMKKTNVNPPAIRHIESVIGKRIFNNSRFNKWEMYQILRKHPMFRHHLPETAICRNMKDLALFLKKHKSIYIKPITGARGAGISKLSTTGGRFVLYRKPRTGIQKITFRSLAKATQYLSKKLKRRQYVLQQTLHVLTSKDRLVDFRLILVKNQDGVWQDMGLVGKHGPLRNIISNVSAGGSAELGEQTLSRIAGLSAEEVQRVRNEISCLGLEVAKYFDSTGLHFANLGLDIAMDVNGKLWIIEVNHVDPAHSLMVEAGAPDQYRQILLTNMQYAKRLAGFANESC